MVDPLRPASPKPVGHRRRYVAAHRRQPSRSKWLARWLGATLALVVVAGGVVVAAKAGQHTGERRVSTGAELHTPSIPVTTTASVATASVPAITAPPVQTVTLTAVGDTELGNTPQVPGDPASYLAPVKSALAAPIVFGNLEGTLTNASTSKCGPTTKNCFAFRTPPSFAVGLHSAGFTVLNSANNHSYDFGAQGVVDTRTALQKAGIAQTGLPGQIAVVNDGATKVAFVAFAPYANVNNMLDLARAKTLIHQAKGQADVVIVYMHAGAEGTAAEHVTNGAETFDGENRGNAKLFAHAAMDDGASLVLASGPHTLRGIEFYGGHLIAYSLGDFAGDHNFTTAGTLGLSTILRVTLDAKGNWVGGSVVSLLLDGGGRPSLDPSGGAARFVNGLSATDFGPAAATINASGAIVAPQQAA